MKPMTPSETAALQWWAKQIVRALFWCNVLVGFAVLIYRPMWVIVIAFNVHILHDILRRIRRYEECRNA